jgi:hemoglobin-like flavoprotein
MYLKETQMIKDIQVDTEALVVDAYPLMNEAHQGAEIFDIAWGFYGAMVKQHPEVVNEYCARMQELLQAVRDIQSASQPDHLKRAWFTKEELEEVPNTHGKMFYIKGNV